jgi:CheY-like chemotaxis protein
MPQVQPPLVLIVDDFEDALDIYQEYLTFKGYGVLTARSGREAITIALAEQPDLILMDLRMAHMTGTEAMTALRAEPAFRKVPIIAFTAHALEDERQMALCAGFDGLIPKPCLPDELLAAVQRLLASAPQVT